jgi:hypothetical protein
MSPESVQRFRVKTCAKSRTYSVSRESFFTRHAVGGATGDRRTGDRVRGGLPLPLPEAEAMEHAHDNARAAGRANCT